MCNIKHRVSSKVKDVKLSVLVWAPSVVKQPARVSHRALRSVVVGDVRTNIGYALPWVFTGTSNWPRGGASVTTTVINHCVCSSFHLSLTNIYYKQEGPEGPGTLTWDRRFLRVPFFHCFMNNRRHLGGLNLKAI